MADKRYTRTQAEELLARLVAFAEAGEGASVGVGKGLLTKLISARLGDTIVGSDARRELENWTTSQVRARQRSLAQFLRMFLIPIGFEIQVNRLLLGAVQLGSDVALKVDGSAGDVLLFQTISLLRVAGVRRLQACACGRVFARIGRQEFCSERCQKRVYMRNRRADERAERERGHGKKTRARGR